MSSTNATSCSLAYERAADNEVPTTLWTRSENQASKPKLIEIVANTATEIVGNNDIVVNTPAKRKCNLNLLGEISSEKEHIIF